MQSEKRMHFGISRPDVPSVTCRIAEELGQVAGDCESDYDAHVCDFRWRWFMQPGDAYLDNLTTLLQGQLVTHSVWDTLSSDRQLQVVAQLREHLVSTGLHFLRGRAQQLNATMRSPEGHKFLFLMDDEIEQLSDGWLELFILDALVEQAEACGVAPGPGDLPCGLFRCDSEGDPAPGGSPPAPAEAAPSDPRWVEEQYAAHLQQNDPVSDDDGDDGERLGTVFAPQCSLTDKLVDLSVAGVTPVAGVASDADAGWAARLGDDDFRSRASTVQGITQNPTACSLAQLRVHRALQTIRLKEGEIEHAEANENAKNMSALVRLNAVPSAENLARVNAIARIVREQAVLGHIEHEIVLLYHALVVIAAHADELDATETEEQMSVIRTELLRKHGRP